MRREGWVYLLRKVDFVFFGVLGIWVCGRGFCVGIGVFFVRGLRLV